MFKILLNEFLQKQYGNDGGTSPPPPPPPPVTTFTQEQVNAMMNDHKKGLQTQLVELQKKLEAGDPVQLQAKIQELNNSLLSKEDQAKAEVEQTRLKLEGETNKWKAAAEIANTRWQDLLVENEITKVGGKLNAYDPAQLIMLLGKSAKVVENTDDKGKGIGTFKVVLPSQVEGKAVDLAAEEYISKMREDKRFLNLFKVDGTPGAGLTLNLSGQIPGNTGDMPMDDEAYQKEREARKEKGTW